MDPIQQHLIQQLTAVRAVHAAHPPQAPPPPYTASDTDPEDEEEDDAPPSPPLKLTINAAHMIQGSSNVVPISPTAITEVTRLSACLVQTISNLNNAANAGGSKRPLKVDLTINCGVNVVGDRNVIGNIGLKPRSLVALGGGNVAAGAKRKADDVDEEDGAEPQAKRVAVQKEKTVKGEKDI